MTMKSKLKIVFSLLLFFGLFLIPVKAQDDAPDEVSNQAVAKLTLGVTEVSLVKVVTPNPTIEMTLNPRTAGLSVETSKADSSARLLISSLVSTDQFRTIKAKITDGDVPAGTVLKLNALVPNADFKGDWGKLAPLITLDKANDQEFIHSIASCYSGVDTDDGYPLKFTYALDSETDTYRTIRATNGNVVTVTLTLSQ
jgi:hypothetical protein